MPSISIDYYGTLNKNTAFWKELLKYVKLEGIKVYIISGNWPSYIKGRLENEGYISEVHYDHVYSILGYLSSKGIDTWLDEEHDSWYSNQNDWWNVKAIICKTLNCQIHFDSDIRFGKAFVGQATRFICLDNNKNMSQIQDWHKKLKLANTYYDDDDDFYGTMGMMSGFVPM